MRIKNQEKMLAALKNYFQVAPIPSSISDGIDALMPKSPLAIEVLKSVYLEICHEENFPH